MNSSKTENKKIGLRRYYESDEQKNVIYSTCVAEVVKEESIDARANKLCILNTIESRRGFIDFLDATLFVTQLESYQNKEFINFEQVKFSF